MELDEAPDGGVGTIDAAASGMRLTVADVEAFVSALGRLDTDVDDAGRVAQLSALERVKGAAAAAQARVSVDLHRSQSQVHARQGVPARQRGTGVADQIALARRESKVRGSRHLGLARALLEEMPHTMAALQAGDISEWRATLMVKETAVLSVADRREVDARLAGRLAGMGDRQTEHTARALAYELDRQAPLRRARGAVGDRRVSIRPAPDTMAMITALVPVAQGVAAFAALQAHAKGVKAQGDERSTSQIMADAFVERLTGQALAVGVPIEVGLVMTDRSMTGQEDTPAHIPGYGPVPAAVARNLLATGNETTDSAGRDSTDSELTELADRAKVWLRRLYASPIDGALVSMDSRRRLFDGMLRRFVVARDGVCRTPWCDAPVRHADHIRPDHAGGETSADNGQGLCERCNYVKEWPGWTTQRVPGDGQTHVVTVTTPAGDTYTSAAPPVLAHLAPQGGRAGPEASRADPDTTSSPEPCTTQRRSMLEEHLQALIDAA